jgi:NAD-dependent oxidoreductase involved in siderophore biosynthesis
VVSFRLFRVLVHAVFHGPSIWTKTNWWPTQTDENNFTAHPYFLRPTLAVTLWPVPKCRWNSKTKWYHECWQRRIKNILQEYQCQGVRTNTRSELNKLVSSTINTLYMSSLSFLR